ncbi:uncharacterized protein [Amphiura filiformis]
MSTPQMSEALLCAICIHMLDDQFKVLDCGHSYCLKCLESLLASKSRRRRGTIICPKCKQVTNLPLQGLEGLKTNFDLKAALEVIRESSNGNMVVAPVGPLRDDKIGMAQMNLNNATEEYQDYLKDSKDLVKRVKDSAKAVEYDINEHFRAMLTVLEENKKRLLQDVEEVRNSRIGRIEEERAKAEKRVKMYKDCRERLKKLDKMKPSEEECEAQVNCLSAEADALTSNSPPEICQNLSWIEYVPETKAGSIQCGRIKTDRKIELDLQSEFGRGWLSKLGKARGIAVTTMGWIAVAESSSNRVSVWEEMRGEYVRKFCLRTPWHYQSLNKPTDVAVTAGDNFVVVDAANTIKVFSSSGEYDPNEWEKEEGTTCVTSHPRLHDGERILMDSRQDIAKFDLPDHHFILPPIAAGTVSHAIATNGKIVAISNLREVKIFDADTGQKLLNFEARVRGLCFDDETESILATTCDRQIGQYCVKTGQLLAMVNNECLNDPWGLAIIPGRRLAVTDDQIVKIYRIVDHQ